MLPLFIMLRGICKMVHKFTLDDANIVLDVYSGAVHVVDKLTMEILKLSGMIILACRI